MKNMVVTLPNRFFYKMSNITKNKTRVEEIPRPGHEKKQFRLIVKTYMNEVNSSF